VSLQGDYAKKLLSQAGQWDVKMTTSSIGRTLRLYTHREKDGTITVQGTEANYGGDFSYAVNYDPKVGGTLDEAVEKIKATAMENLLKAYLNTDTSTLKWNKLTSDEGGWFRTSVLGESKPFVESKYVGYN